MAPPARSRSGFPASPRRSRAVAACRASTPRPAAWRRPPGPPARSLRPPASPAGPATGPATAGGCTGTGAGWPRWDGRPELLDRGLREGKEGPVPASPRHPPPLPRSAAGPSHPPPPFRSPLPGRVGLPRWVRLPGRTVRTRLTILYGILFVFSGALLLTISSGVAVGPSSVSAVPAAINSAPATPLGQANARIHQLQAQISQLQSQAAGAPVQNKLSHVLLISSLIALAIMTVISVGLGWLVAGRALRPVRQMTAAAQRISEDSLHERLAVQGPEDELKELGDTIDGLLERLEVAFSAQRRFVAHSSPELRTPLATMPASLAVALAKPAPAPPPTPPPAGRLRAELDKIDRLLEAFLVLARAQHRALPGRAVIPLDYAVGAALADQAAAIRAMNLTVQQADSLGSAWVTGSQALITRMVENVIDNAVCHNTEGGWIRIVSPTAAGRARLIVENGGTPL